MDVANEVGADAVAHGCTGKGNDQACFVIHLFILNASNICPKTFSCLFRFVLSLHSLL